MVTYFAYGSNLCFRRFRDRVPSARLETAGRVRGFQLRWHKRSNVDGSGKCSIMETGDPTDAVHGVVYSMLARDEPLLDRVEGLGLGYSKSELVVETAAGAFEAMVYIAEPSHVDDALRPLSWYSDLVVAGARDAGLPEDYVAGVAAVEADADPDVSRDAANRAAIPCGCASAAKHTGGARTRPSETGEPGRR